MTALRTFEVAAKQMSFNYIIVIGVVEHGQGVVMDRHRLIGKSLAEGKLVTFRDFSISTLGAFYLTWPENAALNHDAECFRKWLLHAV